MRNDRVQFHYSWLKKNGSSLELSNPVLAAALMCRSWYWGHTANDRRRLKRGEGYEYRAAPLNMIEKRFEPQKRLLCVIFILGGDSEALDLRRKLFANAQVFVHPDDFKKQYVELLTHIKDAERVANEKLEQMKTIGGIPL